MKEIKTICIKLNNIPADEYLELLRQGTALFNFYTQWAYENKTWNKNTCHVELYKKAIEKFPSIKTALIQSIRDNAMECCKALKLKGKKPPCKKETSAIRLDKRTISFRGNAVSIIGITKRHKEIVHICDYYRPVFDTWVFKSATLVFYKKKKQFWLHCAFENPKQINERGKEKVAGIDRGLYHLAVLSDGTFFSSSKIRAMRRKHLYNKRNLQQKGTCSAKRKLKNLSQREARFMKDVNHQVTKKIATSDFDVFVLEKLTGVRQERRGKVLNKWMSNWAFFQFQTFLEYKAMARGKHVKYVSAKYTSKKCSNCGNMHSQSRNKSRYTCITCGYKNHADLNAAINIKQNYILSITSVNKSMEQAVINQPKASDNFGCLDANLGSCTLSN